jgi:hypothetical protein
LTILGGCKNAGPHLVLQPLSTPAPSGSEVPQLAASAAGESILSWQRSLSNGTFTFEMAERSGSRWSPVRQIASGKLSHFSADLPGIVPMSDGGLFAYWETSAASGEDPYATVIQSAVSTNYGQSWSAPAKPYPDSHNGQHSFLSGFPLPGGVGLVWLDAGAQSAKHSMTQQESEAMGAIGLRYASLDTTGHLRDTAFVDPIACECCPTGAAVTANGPVVVYRDREEATGTQAAEVNPYRPTVRDIAITRLQNGQWKPSHIVHADHWVINACPDNGPAVDAIANNLVVAWWTAAGDQPRVQVAFSKDAGDSFSPAYRIDNGKGNGQVTVVLLQGGESAVVGWQEDGQTWACYVDVHGVRSRPISLGLSPHHSRLPRWLLNPDNSVTAVWTRSIQDKTQVAAATLLVIH